MTLDEVLQTVDAGASRDALAPEWEKSLGALPEGLPAFLDMANVRQWRAMCELDDAYEKPLEAVVRQISGNEALRLLAWHGYRAAYYGADVDFLRWPDMSGIKPASGVFFLLLALAAVPVIIERNRLKGAPEGANEAAFAEIGQLCAQAQGEARELVGLPATALTFLQHQLSGSARIGRFRYARTCFNGYFEIYRERETARTMAIAFGDYNFNDKGLMDFDPDPGFGWVSRRRDDEHAVAGIPISPLGRALREEVRLPHAQWRRVITYGEYSLSLHIPGGAPLDPEACRDSMLQAEAFFNRHFPEPVSVCTLVSWIASPILGKILPAGANLARFQQEAYLYPVPARGDEHLNKIFGPPPFDPATAPADTTLRKNLLEYLRRGGKWYWGGLFFLFEGLPQFGEQWYRSNWA
ncbi:MAG: hypothetical protein ACYDCO_03365 [Armatimonadota bacterium]